MLQPSQKQALVALLEHHSCLDEKEERDRQTMVDFIRRHDDAHLRRNLLGHLTGSALLLDRHHRVLLTHHRKLNRWLQVGGHGEGEWDPAEIAHREAREESGLSQVRFHPLCPLDESVGRRKPFDLDVHVIPKFGDTPQHLHLDWRYVLETDQDPEDIVRTEESKDLEWFGIDEALAMASDPSLMRALRALRSSLDPASVRRTPRSEE